VSSHAYCSSIANDTFCFIIDRLLRPIKNIQAKRTLDAVLHPDTGEVIPQPFRMSGYLPYNGPISTMMVASTTTPSLLFFAWMNQSQNALVNYFNRNANSPMSNETLALSYGGAVGSALSVAFGLSFLIKKRYKDPSEAARMMKFIAFPR